jgi:hypothetical protein
MTTPTFSSTQFSPVPATSSRKLPSKVYYLLLYFQLRTDSDPVPGINSDNSHDDL